VVSEFATSGTDIAIREYKIITIDYPLAAAEAFSSLSDKFKFVYISGILPAALFLDHALNHFNRRRRYKQARDAHAILWPY
jgi:hypothetical protein